MADIFISYAREDETRIRDLVRALEEHGLVHFLGQAHSSRKNLAELYRPSSERCQMRDRRLVAPFHHTLIGSLKRRTMPKSVAS